MNDDVVQMTVDGQTYRYDRATGDPWETDEQKLSRTLDELSDSIALMQKALVKIIEVLAELRK